MASQRGCLVLFETSGNQEYIYATNKLGENVGASHLTWLAGTQFVLEAVEASGGPSLWPAEATAEALRTNILNGAWLPLERGGVVEVVIATSGKAVLLVDSRSRAEAIVRRATERALRDAPSLDLSAAVSDEFDFGSGQLAAKYAALSREHGAVHAHLPANALRFQRLPVAMDCSVSRLPAAGFVKEGKEWQERSRMSMAKQRYKDEGMRRIRRLAAARDRRLRRTMDELTMPGLGDGEPGQREAIARLQAAEARLERIAEADDATALDPNWLAVVHADVNGLGMIFQEFECLSGAATDREYVDRLRLFSVAVDACTEAAFQKALGGKVDVALLPIVLGGDDLTVACAAGLALPFTKAFLAEFERQTARGDQFDGIVPAIAAKASGGVGRLAACAGIAIVKPHFPFHAAYGLAEELTTSAKEVKRRVVSGGRSVPVPCSAIDVHVLYDSSVVSLKQIRQGLTAERQENGRPVEEVRRWLRPFIVTDHASLGDLDEPAWVEARLMSTLERRARALRAEDEGDRLLPNSQMHELRAGLAQGRNEADRRFEYAMSVYSGRGLDLFDEGIETPTLYVTRRDGEDEPLVYETGLLDAMDIAPFLGAAAEEEP